jgi:hypothetical protein
MPAFSRIRLAKIYAKLSFLGLGILILASTPTVAEDSHYCRVHEFKNRPAPHEALPPREIDMCKKGDIIIFSMDQFTYARSAQTRVAQYCDLRYQIFVNNLLQGGHRRLACRFIGHRRTLRRSVDG